jgi:micrococcal nuclease
LTSGGIFAYCFLTNCCKITGTDNYGRALGFTYLEDGRELGQEMIKAGLAWHYKKYNSDTALANFEKEARRLKKGLWLDKNPKAPWEVRRLRRQGVSAKDSFNISPH